MHIIHVCVHVKKDTIEDFKQATMHNARNSVCEAGVVRFDVIQQQDDPARFVLVEVYKTPEDQLLHKETGHYQTWRDTVADMMEEPRKGIQYTNVYPDNENW